MGEAETEEFNEFALDELIIDRTKDIINTILTRYDSYKKETGGKNYSKENDKRRNFLLEMMKFEEEINRRSMFDYFISIFSKNNNIKKSKIKWIEELLSDKISDLFNKNEERKKKEDGNSYDANDITLAQMSSFYALYELIYKYELLIFDGFLDVLFESQLLEHISKNIQEEEEDFKDITLIHNISVEGGIQKLLVEILTDNYEYINKDGEINKIKVEDMHNLIKEYKVPNFIKPDGESDFEMIKLKDIGKTKTGDYIYEEITDYNKIRDIIIKSSIVYINLKLYHFKNDDGITKDKSLFDITKLKEKLFTSKLPNLTYEDFDEKISSNPKKIIDNVRSVLGGYKKYIFLDTQKRIYDSINEKRMYKESAIVLLSSMFGKFLCIFKLEVLLNKINEINKISVKQKYNDIETIITNLKKQVENSRLSFIEPRLIPPEELSTCQKQLHKLSILYTYFSYTSGSKDGTKSVNFNPENEVVKFLKTDTTETIKGSSQVRVLDNSKNIKFYDGKFYSSFELKIDHYA